MIHLREEGSNERQQERKGWRKKKEVRDGMRRREGVDSLAVLVAVVGKEDQSLYCDEPHLRAVLGLTKTNITRRELSPPLPRSSSATHVLSRRKVIPKSDGSLPKKTEGALRVSTPLSRDFNDGGDAKQRAHEISVESGGRIDRNGSHSIPSRTRASLEIIPL